MYIAKDRDKFIAKNDTTPQVDEAIAWINENIDVTRQVAAVTKSVPAEEMENYIQMAKARNDIALLGLLLFRQWLENECKK